MRAAALTLSAALATSAASGAAGADGEASARSVPRYSAAALYNAGNAAARSGQHAQAILDYERAQLLAPLDADVRRNLEVVQARAGAGSVAARDWLRRAHVAPAPAVYEGGVVGLLLAGMALLARARWPRGAAAPALGLIGGAGAVLLAASVIDALATAPVLKDAVVMHASAATASPTPAGATLFTVPAGETVALEDSHGAFWLIRNAQGREGWVPRSGVERVVPRATDS
jgi:hypothetical protein